MEGFRLCAGDASRTRAENRGWPAKPRPLVWRFFRRIDWQAFLLTFAFASGWVIT